MKIKTFQGGFDKNLSLDIDSRSSKTYLIFILNISFFKVLLSFDILQCFLLLNKNNS